MNVRDTLTLQGDLLWPDGAIRPGRLTIQGSRISSLEELPSAGRLTNPSGEVVQVPPGGVAAPGFIDLQVNGAYGQDFTDQPEAIAGVARQIPASGTTAFLATIITAPLSAYTAAIQVLEQMGEPEPGAAQVLGLHFEGPFLHPDKKGAHDPALLRQPALDLIADWDPRYVKLVTLAPDLPGALDLIRELAARGIQPGLGHTNATYNQAVAGIQAGARWCTHIFNAMRSLHHREPGVLGALLTAPEVRVALIPDGVHVHPALMKLVAMVKGPDGVTLISDAMGAAGSPPGEYVLAGRRVIVDETSARLEDGTLAGSCILMDDAVRGMVRLAQRPLAEALQMASAAPARFLGLDQKGKLTPGCDADIVILDQDLQVRQTFVRGQAAL